MLIISPKKLKLTQRATYRAKYKHLKRLKHTITRVVRFMRPGLVTNLNNNQQPIKLRLHRYWYSFNMIFTKNHTALVGNFRTNYAADLRPNVLNRFVALTTGLDFDTDSDA